MSQKQSPSRMMILLPLLFLMNKVDFENELILNSARGAFVLCQVLSVLTYLYIKTKVEQQNDTRKIFIPGVTSALNPTPNYDDVTESTYRDHELNKTNELIKQTLIGAAISTFIHVKMGVNHVVLIQSVMAPLNLYDNALVQKFIFGKAEGRIWNEKLEGEPLVADDDATTGTTATPAAGSSSSSAKTKKQPKAKTANVTPAEAIAQALAAGADADFDGLWDVVKGDVNAKTTDDSWTALMVACGSPVDTDEFIGKLLAAGADVTAVDGDGWTALHWAAFHGRPEAAETLLTGAPKAKLAQLLVAKSKDGKTAIEVATEEENADVVDVLAKFGGAPTASATENDAESELRRRKPAAATDGAASGIDEVD